MSPVSFIRPPIHIPSNGEPLDNSWTLPDIVDFNAKHNPDSLFCYQKRKDSHETKMFAITHLALRNAVVSCQSWLVENIAGIRRFEEQSGASSSGRRPIALFMESNVGLWVYMLALLGLDVPVLLLSARLGVIPVKHLLDKTNTRAVVVSPRLRTVLKNGPEFELSVEATTIYEQRAWEHFLDENGTASERHSICSMNRSRVGSNDAIILHSSGTTGLPKPIYHPHQYLLGFAAAHCFDMVDDIPSLNCSTLPLYHVSCDIFFNA